jgi:ribosomal protein S18 acetylase RimI-like enzyme
MSGEPTWPGPDVERGSTTLTSFLIDLSPHDMQRRLSDALNVYVDAMRYPRGTEDQRASMWLEHTRRHGWRAVAAVQADTETTERPDAEQLAAAPLLGVAYGYRGAPDQWWQQQVSRGLHRIGFPRDQSARLMSDYFELTELHIHPSAQGRGLGEALARHEQRVGADQQRAVDAREGRVEGGGVVKVGGADLHAARGEVSQLLGRARGGDDVGAPGLQQQLDDATTEVSGRAGDKDRHVRSWVIPPGAHRPGMNAT